MLSALELRVEIWAGKITVSFYAALAIPVGDFQPEHWNCPFFAREIAHEVNHAGSILACQFLPIVHPL